MAKYGKKASEKVERAMHEMHDSHVENIALCEALLPRRSNHQLGRRQPTIAVLATDFGFVDVARERPP